MSTVVQQQSTGWLRSWRFDAFFIGGIAFVALASGAIIAARPELFLMVFFVDLWLLGYHHVVSTFTRLCFDRASFAQHKALVLYLPLAVVAGVVVIYLVLGAWALMTIYLYWQWWHYTRQSWGISRAYAAKSRDRPSGNRLLCTIAFWSMPIAGILTVSSRSPGQFLWMPLWTLPVPGWMAQLAIALAASAVLLWIIDQLRLARRGAIAVPYVLFMLSHFAIYATAYLYFTDLTQGWVVINIWHNAQYIAFVWMFNNRRFASGVDPQHRFLSVLSQPRLAWLYLLVCVGISTAFYTAAVRTADALALMPYMIVFYQAINFHHYLVDAKIWKLRKQAVSAHVGV
jgi:hypothetical protein